MSDASPSDHVPGGRASFPPLLLLPALAAILAGLWLGLHLQALDAPFYFDSEIHLVLRNNLHMAELSWDSLDRAIHREGGAGVYRPLAAITLALNYFFGGLEPGGYRVVNLLVHGGAALALHWLFVSALGLPKVERTLPLTARSRSWVAATAAALWFVHPVHTNVTVYVIQRMASLAGLFTFLAIAAYLRARGSAAGWSWRWGGAALGAFFLALASKESALTVLPCVALSEWLLLEPPARREARRALAVIGSATAAAMVAGGVLVGPTALERLLRVAESRDFSVWERLLTQCVVQVRYLTVLLVPDPRLLTLDADIPVARSLIDPPQTLAAAVLIAAALALALHLRRRKPLLAFGICWYFVHQLVEGTVLPLEFYYEHRLYVPAAFVFLGVAVGGFQLTRQHRRALAALVCAAVAVLSLEIWVTGQRVRTWAEPVAFWADAVQKAPGKPRPRVNLGRALLGAGQYALAEDALWGALAAGADPAVVHVNLATSSFRQGRRGEARAHLLEAIERGGKDVWLAKRALAELSLGDGDIAEAETAAREVLSVRPYDAVAHSVLGAVALRRGDTEAARQLLRRAVALDSSLAQAWNNLGVIAYRRGAATDATRFFRRAARLQPEDEVYRNNLRQAQASSSGVPTPAAGHGR